MYLLLCNGSEFAKLAFSDFMILWTLGCCASLLIVNHHPEFAGFVRLVVLCFAEKFWLLELVKHRHTSSYQE